MLSIREYGSRNLKHKHVSRASEMSLVASGSEYPQATNRICRYSDHGFGWWVGYGVKVLPLLFIWNGVFGASWVTFLSGHAYMMPQRSISFAGQAETEISGELTTLLLSCLPPSQTRSPKMTVGTLPPDTDTLNRHPHAHWGSEEYYPLKNVEILCAKSCTFVRT